MANNPNKQPKINAPDTSSATSVGESDMPDIPALAKEVSRLGQSVKDWNLWVIVAMAVAALAALALVLVQRKAFTVADDWALAQEALFNAKDDQLQRDLKDKDLKIAVASQAASEATAEAARLRKQLQPRTLSEADRETIAKELRPFAKHFAGRRVKVSSYSADAEGVVFSIEVFDILTRAGIQTESLIGRQVPVGIPTMGIKAMGPVADEAFIRTLLQAIHGRLDKPVSDSEGEWDAKYTELEVRVGVKPVAGLPKIVPAKH